MNKLILKEIKIQKPESRIIGDIKYQVEGIIEIKTDEEPSVIGNFMSISSRYTTKLYEGTNDYKICKELIDTENKTLALLNINHKCLGIAVIARKILSI